MVTTVMMTNGDDSWTYPPMSNLARWDIVRWENHCTLMTPWRVDLGNHIWEPLVPYNEDLFLRQVIDRCGYGTHIQLLWLYIYIYVICCIRSINWVLSASSWSKSTLSVHTLGCVKTGTPKMGWPRPENIRPIIWRSYSAPENTANKRKLETTV